MKAIPTLTIHQPSASLIAFGLKPIETRKHNRFHGLVGQTIAIHAGLKTAPPSDVLMDLWMLWGLTGLDIARMARHSIDSAGCVVAVVDVKAHRRLTDADSRAALVRAEGLYGLVLDNVRCFREPIKAKGRQGIWTWQPPPDWRGMLI